MSRRSAPDAAPAVPVPSRVVRTIAWVGFAALLAVHFFAGPSESADEPGRRAGWIPDELMFRILFVFAAWAFVEFVCSFVWRERPGRPRPAERDAS